MFERFTDRARRVVVAAQEEARALGHDYIGTEHLLLGLIQEQGGVAARVLADAGADLGRARGEVIRLLAEYQRRPGPGAGGDRGPSAGGSQGDGESRGSDGGQEPGGGAS